MRNKQKTEDKVVEEPKQEKGKGKKLLFVSSIIMLGVVAYIVYPRIIGPFVSKKDSVKKVEMYQFQRLTTNPAGTAGKRFFVISLAAELDPKKSKKIRKELENKKSQLQHILIEILSSKTVEDLETRKEELRKEILAKLNETLVTGKLKEIYFTEFVIQ